MVCRAVEWALFRLCHKPAPGLDAVEVSHCLVVYSFVSVDLCLFPGDCAERAEVYL